MAKTGLWAAGAVAIAAAGAVQAEEDITVTHWGVLMYGAPYAVAMDQGYFAEAGVEIDDILTSSGGGTTVRNVLSGDLLYGETSLAAAVAAHLSGREIVIVNTGADTVADLLWVAMPDSDIESIEDFVGKRVTYTRPQSVTDMTLRMALDEAGISSDDVELIAAGGIGDGLTMLEQDGADAVPILEPIWAATRDKYKAVLELDTALPRISQTVGITTPQMIEQKPEELRAVIEGRRMGVQYIQENPEEAARIFANAYEGDVEVMETAINAMLEIDYWSEGALNYEQMDRKMGGLRLVGVIDEDVDWSELVDERFLPEDLRGD